MGVTTVLATHVTFHATLLRIAFELFCLVIRKRRFAVVQISWASRILRSFTDLVRIAAVFTANVILYALSVFVALVPFRLFVRQPSATFVILFGADSFIRFLLGGSFFERRRRFLADSVLETIVLAASVAIWAARVGFAG